MSEEHNDSKSHKHKKSHKDERPSSSRPVKAGSKHDPASQTARQMKLMQKWGGIVQSLREADQCT